MSAPASPAVTVVVSTRNRPEHVGACVESVLAMRDIDFELVVVDQSDTDESQRSVAASVVDARLRWIRTDTRGLSTSRNIAIDNARAPILVFTDDDCRVEPTWASGIAARFAADPALGMVFGRVALALEDRTQGFAADFEPAADRWLVGSLPEAHEAWGVGANMAVRRSAFDQIGTFDPKLGAGAALHAAEETDLTIRAVTAGLKVLYTPSVSVTHLGVRHGADASRLMRGYGIGLGAALMKHARLGTPGAKRLLANWVAAHARRSVGNALRGDRHPGFGLVAAVVWGGCRSFGFGLDRRRAVYVDR
jgi:glycosyltransferase involved in cell wall biosynthesis